MSCNSQIITWIVVKVTQPIDVNVCYYSKQCIITLGQWMVNAAGGRCDNR
jgi:hypothetical protein